MRRLVALLSAFSLPAQAHESLAPHAHPHGLSMLAGTDAVICTLLLALVVAVIIFWRFVRVP